MPQSVRVLGLGHVLMGDDGFGPAAIETFRCMYDCGPEVEVLDLGTPGLDITPYMYGIDLVILADCVAGDEQPGRLHVYREADLSSRDADLRLNSHDPGMRGCLAQLKLVGHAPSELLIVGVIPESCQLGEAIARLLRECAQLRRIRSRACCRTMVSSAHGVLLRVRRRYGGCKRRTRKSKLTKLIGLFHPTAEADGHDFQSISVDRQHALSNCGPISGAPLFLALTPDYTIETRRALAWRVSIDCFWVLLAAYFVGAKVLFSRTFYPLAMPLTVGPGSIGVAITLGANNAHHYGFHLLLFAVTILGLAAVGASIYLCYAFANRLVPKLGATGMAIMVRLSSFLLICIGVQITWNGVSALLSSLVFHVR